MKEQRNNSKPIDLNYLTSITGGDQGKLVELLNIFLDQAPRTLSQLTTSVGLMQEEQVKAHIAQLKANLDYIGKKELIHSLSDLEIAFSTEQDDKQVRQLMKDIETQMDRLKTDINSLVKFLLND